MNNEIKEKYLPIGTVVQVKGAEVPLMITGYCAKPQDKNEISDYCGCTYPVGVVDSNLNVLFNHDNIEKVLYMGYESEVHTEYCKLVKEEVAKLNKGEVKEEN